MSEAPAPKEGWSVRAGPPILWFIGTLAVIAATVAGFGFLYAERVAQRTRPPFATFPSPRLELAQTPPGQPRRDFRQPGPPAATISQAMAETAAEGNALWNGTGR